MEKIIRYAQVLRLWQQARGGSSCDVIYVEHHSTRSSPWLDPSSLSEQSSERPLGTSATYNLACQTTEMEKVLKIAEINFWPTKISTKKWPKNDPKLLKIAQK